MRSDLVSQILAGGGFREGVAGSLSLGGFKTVSNPGTRRSLLKRFSPLRVQKYRHAASSLVPMQLPPRTKWLPS
jgi:hypothetical protein